jgi:DNA-binding NarL/FixJ family response regulator
VLIMGRAKTIHRTPGTWNGLTPGEEKVLIGLCKYGSHKRTAAALGIHLATVSNHTRSIFIKLGCDNMTHACLLYFQTRLRLGLPIALILTPTHAGAEHAENHSS